MDNGLVKEVVIVEVIDNDVDDVNEILRDGDYIILTILPGGLDEDGDIIVYYHMGKIE